MVTLRSMAFPMAPMMLIASSPRPPSVSATMGMNRICAVTKIQRRREALNLCSLGL